MTPFKAPVDDILSSLKTVVTTATLSDWDDNLATQILEHFATFAEGEIAPLDQSGDLQGCVLDSGNVRMPDGFTEAFAALADGGWQGLSAPEKFGGMAQNALIAAAVSEVFSGANHSMQMVCNLVPGAISTLLRFGDENQQEKWIPRLVAGEALSTMCLTEPAAGSDLSRCRTRAIQTDGIWHISGEKIFISGGDQNMSDDILHLVLARTGEFEDGVKGLSLFLCCKSEAGCSIRVTRIEEKLGLHASPTCHMVFDNAPGDLIGEEGGGLTAMFTLMNHARIDVALQGVAHAARANAISSAYACDRVQGRKPDGSDAVLSEHPDVRRMLDEQRCLAMGARTMAHLTLVQLMRGDRLTLVDFLTPLCKVFCTEAGIRSADVGIQILGGYGYLTEYRISQTWRDARITSIYEGANGIHELATVTRGLRVSNGAGADAFAELIAELTSDPGVQSNLYLWTKARQWVSESSRPYEHSHDFTQLTCDLFFRAIWSVIADSDDDPELARLRDVVFARPLPVSKERFTNT